MEWRLAAGTYQLPDQYSADALSGFVGPMEMASSSVLASAPAKYSLAPGDTVDVTFWGPMLDPARLTLTVDKQGYITVPKAGKFVARGMTLHQLRETLRSKLEEVTVKGLNLIATLEELKSIQVYVAGEAFRPGSYAVSAVTTLFNAIFAAGGPTEKGSLRNIRLIRGQETFHVDLYKYLIEGDSSSDMGLEPGDTVYIPPSSKTVSIAGEVRRPGEYELMPTDGLGDLLKLALGPLPSAMTSKIQILTKAPHREHRMLDVDFTKGEDEGVRLYHGDTVLLSPIEREIENVVLLEGAVETPGVFELSEGMRVSSLFSALNTPLGEAYLERADLIRVNDDLRTTTLLPFDLGKALAGDPANDHVLERLDRVKVYSRWDVEFIPQRTVSVYGAVQSPGESPRHDGMRVMDLITAGGGLLPNIYHKRADLLRFDFVNQSTDIIPVELDKILEGDAAANIEVADSDVLRIYTRDEIEYRPLQQVSIFGSIQRPDDYPYSENMTLKDLIFTAGGPTPGYSETIEIARAEGDGTIKILKTNLKLLIEGDESQNLKLQPLDVVMAKKRTEFLDKPIYVQIKGEVNYAGTYAMSSRYDKLSDLIDRAGGLTRLAYPKGTVFLRRPENIPSEEQRSDLALINEIFNLTNELDFQRQLARNQFLLAKEVNKDDKKGSGPSLTGVPNAAIVSSDDPDKAAAVSMAPGLAQSTSTTIQKGLDAMSPSGSLVTTARKFTEEDLTTTERIIIDVTKTIASPGSPDDITLMPGDEVMIPGKPVTVTVVGAVMRPINIRYKKSISPEDYIQNAGGYAEDANPERVIVLKMDGSVVPMFSEGFLWDSTYAKIEPGDIIYVPPKVLSLEIVSTMDKIMETVRYGFSTLAGVAVFIALLGLF